MAKKEKAKGKPKDWNKVIGTTYEDRKTMGPEHWRQKMRDRKEMISYIRSSERYWYMDQDEWYGSEKRKTKA